MRRLSVVVLVISLASAAQAKSIGYGESSQAVFGARLKPPRSSYGVLVPSTTPRVPITTTRSYNRATLRTRAPIRGTPIATTTFAPELPTWAPVAEAPVPELPVLAPVVEAPLPELPALAPVAEAPVRRRYHRNRKGRRHRKRPRISIVARRLQDENYQQERQQSSQEYQSIAKLNNQNPISYEQHSIPQEISMYHHKESADQSSKELLYDHAHITTQANSPAQPDPAGYDTYTSTNAYESIEHIHEEQDALQETPKETHTDPKLLTQQQDAEEEKVNKQQDESYQHKEVLSYNQQTSIESQSPEVLSYGQAIKDTDIREQYEMDSYGPSIKKSVSNGDEQGQEMMEEPRATGRGVSYDDEPEQQDQYEQMEVTAENHEQNLPSMANTPVYQKDNYQIYTSPEPYETPSREQAYQKEIPYEQIHTTPRPLIRIHELKKEHVSQDVPTTPESYKLPLYQLAATTEKPYVLPSIEDHNKEESLADRPTPRPYRPARLMKEQRDQEVLSYRHQPLHSEIYPTMKPYKPLKLVQEDVQDQKHYDGPSYQEGQDQIKTGSQNQQQDNGYSEQYEAPNNDMRPYEHVYKREELPSPPYTSTDLYEQKMITEGQGQVDEHLMDRKHYAQIYRQLESQPKWEKYIREQESQEKKSQYAYQREYFAPEPQNVLKEEANQPISLSYQYSVPEQKEENIEDVQKKPEQQLTYSPEQLYTESEHEKEEYIQTQHSSDSYQQDYSNLEPKESKENIKDVNVPETPYMYRKAESDQEKLIRLPAYAYEQEYSGEERSPEDKQNYQEYPNQYNEDKHGYHEAEKAPKMLQDEKQYAQQYPSQYPLYEQDYPVTESPNRANDKRPYVQEEQPGYHQEYDLMNYRDGHSQKVSPQENQMMNQHQEQPRNQDEVSLYDQEYSNVEPNPYEQDSYGHPNGQNDQRPYQPMPAHMENNSNQQTY